MYRKSPYMELAFVQARLALEQGEVPIGAVIVKNSEILASTHNLSIKNINATAHAEMLAIEAASRLLSSVYLDDCSIYVSLEPCPMCMGAIKLARISKLYFASYRAKDPNIGLEIYSGIGEKEGGEILRNFFLDKRSKI